MNDKEEVVIIEGLSYYPDMHPRQRYIVKGRVITPGEEDQTVRGYGYTAIEAIHVAELPNNQSRRKISAKD